MKPAIEKMKHPRWRPIWIFSAVALCIMGPMWLPGYILTLDMVFTPHIPWPQDFNNMSPFFALLHVLNIIVPAQILQKVILLAILVLSGYGGFLLLRHIARDVKSFPQSMWISYAAGLLYMVNPFVYSRFMAGQYLVLVGYALLPFFVRLLLKWCQNGGTKTALQVGALGAAVCMFSIHSTGILALLLLFGVGLCLLRYWRNLPIMGYFLWQGIKIIGTFMLLSSYWLVPLLIGSGSTAAAIGGFSADDFSAFATTGSGIIGKIGNVLQLQGFWADAKGFYWLPQDVMFLWPLAMLLLWILVAGGAISLWRQSKFITAFFALSGLAGVIAASGILQEPLSNIIPQFAGYREPQKFAVLVALSFVVFAACGAGSLMRRISSPVFLQGWMIIVVLLPVILAPTMFFGFFGQLRPKNYPPDWSEVNKTLRTSGGGQVLFLPWHQYMTFGFAGRIIANPAEKYFSAPVIASDNPEIGNVRPTVPNPQKRQIEDILSNTPQTQGLGDALAKHNIQYVLVAKEFDFEQYRYFDRQPDFTLISDSQTLTLYLNKAFNQEP